MDKTQPFSCTSPLLAKVVALHEPAEPESVGAEAHAAAARREAVRAEAPGEQQQALEQQRQVALTQRHKQVGAALS